MNRFRRTLHLLLLVTTLGVSGNSNGQAVQQSSSLPEMGDSSATTLSQEDEQRIGAEMVQQLQRRGAIAKDPIINEYINSLGHTLSSAAVTNRNRFDYFVVNARSINAFALPGGYIGVHAGLILASESENELAAVLAHEIAHVTQRHIARSVEHASKMNLPMTAAVIAALLIGGSDPQVANAALAASLGGSQQMQLDFTRANEQEADRVGMQLLAVSDFEPSGMSSFFARLQNESRYYGDGVPEFLRTHPVNSSRIAEAEDRARRYPSLQRDDSIHYLLTKARIRLMLSDSPQKLAQTLRDEEPKNETQREARTYLTALILHQQGETDAARQSLTSLLKQHPGRIAYIYTLAELEREQGAYPQASSLYQAGLRQYPGNALLTTAYAETLIDAGRYPDAREQLDTLLRNEPQNSEAYRLLARLEAKRNNLAASYLAQAEYYYLIGERHSALDQLMMAKRLTPLPDYYQSRIDARLEQLKAELARDKVQQ